MSNNVLLTAAQIQKYILDTSFAQRCVHFFVHCVVMSGTPPHGVSVVVCCRLLNLDLSNISKHLLKPLLMNIKRFATFNSFEFNGANGSTFLIFVLTHATRNAFDSTPNSFFCAFSNQGSIELIGSCRTSKITRLLYLLFQIITFQTPEHMCEQKYLLRKMTKQTK